MMTRRVKALVDRGKRDKDFIALIKAVDNDKPPGLFSSTLEKTFFAAVYHGYLIGKDWKVS